MNDLFQIMVSILKPTIEIYPFEALIMDSYVLVLAASSGKNLDLAHRFSESFTEKGMETQIVDLTTLHWPVYTSELDGDPEREPDTATLSDLILNSEALVICAPEYNGVMPPALNNTIAWLSVQSDDFRRLFNNRTVLLATHSGGGGAHCLMAMRHQFSFLGSNVIGRTMNLNKSKPFSQEKMDDLVGRVLE
ncbi:MAG: NADPH-dependent oxidoreductase [Euryarchaeota archaeon]|jgi:chromate reductase|nr:NADPH-dependent oxidoreductase [Euryarchaeota archaeon]|tara:strand:- start:1785 stop:2360 length:576 start_codon:yes stop_codon:yes gene_type:complete